MKSTFLSNKTPALQLSCTDCGIVKTSTEEMEIHIKVEHLNWLPFQCPVCLTTRASDSMMREHIHTAHGANTGNFVYIDDMKAKRNLQQLMDKAIHASIRKLSSTTAANGESRNEKNMQPSSSKAKSPSPGPSSGIPVVVTPTAGIVAPEISPERSAMNALLASINSSVACDSGLVPEETKINTEIGAEEMNFNFLDSLNSLGVFGDIAAAASSPSSKKKVNQSRRAVVGNCKKCGKDISRGSRQMHVYMHLSKDEKLNRFRCLFDNCTYEIHRKDQVEHHQSKIHGAIDHMKIEDRSLELEARCMEMAKEILGSEESQFMQFGKKEEKEESRSKTPPPAVPEEDQTLHCQKCNKFMVQKLRSIHILHHLSSDLGINRYVCRECGQASDRQQTIQKHGRTAHGSSDVLLDRIADFSDDLQEMSLKCFGEVAHPTYKDKKGNKRKFTSVLNNINNCQLEKKQRNEEDALENEGKETSDDDSGRKVDEDCLGEEVEL